VTAASLTSSLALPPGSDRVGSLVVQAFLGPPLPGLFEPLLLGQVAGAVLEVRLGASAEARGGQENLEGSATVAPQKIRSLTELRVAPHQVAEDIGRVLKGDANVCQRQLVNEVVGPLFTEFALNLGREAATPIQGAFNASLLGRV
jgi:hypothetical protein